jgi:hypothetical protein
VVGDSDETPVESQNAPDNPPRRRCTVQSEDHSYDAREIQNNLHGPEGMIIVLEDLKKLLFSERDGHIASPANSAAAKRLSYSVALSEVDCLPHFSTTGLCFPSAKRRIVSGWIAMAVFYPPYSLTKAKSRTARVHLEQ